MLPMNKRKLQAILTLAMIVGMLCSAKTAEAGPIVIGNGGKIIQCPQEGAERKYELVDFYEARVLRNWKVKMPSASQDPLEVSAQVLSRIEKLNPSRYKRYQSFLAQFMKEAQFLHGQKLVDIPDSNHPSFPANCEVKQLAIQRTGLGANEARYLIDGDIWEQLDLQSKAGLILHEVIYRELISAGTTNSEQVRFFNSALWANQMQGMDQATYIEFVKKALPDADFEGLNFAICRPGYIEGELHQCARREPPNVRYDDEKKFWLVNGFVPPPWAPWAEGEKHFVEILDPTNQKRTSFLTYGPYQKFTNFIAFSPVLSWIPKVGESRLEYAGHSLDLVGNEYIDFSQIRRGTQREKECFELWSCEAIVLDEKKMEGIQQEHNWARLVLSLDHHLFNFHVTAMVIRPGYGVRSCKGLVNLADDGALESCRAYGTLENEEVQANLDNSFLGFDDKGRLRWATAMKNSRVKFKKQWVKASSVSWHSNGEQRYLSNLTAEQALSLRIWDRAVEASNPWVALNAAGEVARISSKVPLKMKVAGKVLVVNNWLLASEVFVPPKVFPPDAARVHLAASIRLKDTEGIEHKYPENSRLVLNSSGVVFECTNPAWGPCF
jgi:hypothetical protein